MNDFRLYNTLTRSIEAFAPADGETVRMYTCGPTVYNPAHVGNFRTFLFEDLLRRVLRLHGWKVLQVMNLTDVDDKIIKRAVEQNKLISQVTEPVIDVFHQDRAYLRIENAEVYPRATAHIAEMIELVERLLNRGVAYIADDKSVYFAIDRFPEYGRLSRLDTREIRSGARVSQDDYSKENAQDFALWKAAKAEDDATGAAWDAPFGRGRPGWHLECSAMAMKYLGETLDIHCGGVDLVFPHHEDEIAQSEASTGRPFARFWCHGEFLNVEGSKMAKRIGNVTTVQDLRERGVSAAAMRHFVFSTHYRKQINLSAAALEASMEAVARVADFAHRLEASRGGTPELALLAAETERVFRAALDDDLNAPEALAALFSFVQKANAELDRRGSDVKAIDEARRVFTLIDTVLDLQPRAVRFIVSTSGVAPDPAALEGLSDEESVAVKWAVDRLAHRAEARQNRDFAASDSIRADVEARGFLVKDTAEGTVLERYY
ncbi:MAG TPA: cysteine--tRNA ligase [Burkholderiales bacterium]|nr:cysteine--tRNA ligase [Burkholderiales bacterium]